ncbi:MAG: phosphatidylglycerophosphatase A [Erysipelothrix sp.]|nr:phosphatidylglycerophosphatase A [Erysipelothrix sp.]
MTEKCIKALKMRGVSVDDIIDIVLMLQSPYIDDLSREEIEEDIFEILAKREVYHTVMTGIAIDIAVEENKLFDQEIMDSMRGDYGLFGVDEVLAYGICNLYGSIALTNFGYVDKMKPGIIGVVNDDLTRVNTFLDDIIGAIAASAASKLAHTHKKEIKKVVMMKKRGTK